MRKIQYVDLDFELTQLSEVIAQSLEDGRLNIAVLDHECQKFKEVLKNHSKLCQASYVVYSKEMLDYHYLESFLFLDNDGNIVDVGHGSDLSLYNMIKLCDTIGHYSIINDYN